MRGTYFRYLFENPDGGLFHTGSIYDKEKQRAVTYLYMAGSSSRDAPQEEEAGSGRIDLLVMGAYSANYIKKLIAILKNHEIETMILPYLAPIQRLVLAEELKDGSMEGQEAVRFLQDPYQFTQRLAVSNIYFLYGNGAPFQREPEELERGFHFEPADRAAMRQIREMEGYELPVVRAGYLVIDEFLFYFGVYGPNIQRLSEFAVEYFSHIENIDPLSENAGEDYNSQMKRLAREFLRRFGHSSMATVVMFEAPLHTSSEENESFFTEKEFNGQKDDCAGWENNRKGGRLSCVVSCTYGRDYENLQRHKRNAEKMRFGILMLGNLNLNRYLIELLERFLRVLPQVRAIGVPNCGSGENWNHKILELFSGKDRIYWICARHDITSAGVVSDIALSSPNHRVVPVSEEWGCCLSGYLIPKENIDEVKRALRS